LSGRARGDDVLDLAAPVVELHPRHNADPGEVDVAHAGWPASGVTIPSPARHYEKYLGERKFQVRENRNIQHCGSSPRGRAV
jgi:hypothetical protein